jgi:hypothetical protein
MAPSVSSGDEAGVQGFRTEQFRPLAIDLCRHPVDRAGLDAERMDIMVLHAAHRQAEGARQRQTFDIHGIDDAADAFRDRAVIRPVFTELGPRQVAEHDRHVAGRIEVAEHDRENVLARLEPVAEKSLANR